MYCKDWWWLQPVLSVVDDFPSDIRECLQVDDFGNIYEDYYRYVSMATTIIHFDLFLEL